MSETVQTETTAPALPPPAAAGNSRKKQHPRIVRQNAAKEAYANGQTDVPPTDLATLAAQSVPTEVAPVPPTQAAPPIQQVQTPAPVQAAQAATPVAPPVQVPVQEELPPIPDFLQGIVGLETLPPQEPAAPVAPQPDAYQAVIAELQAQVAALREGPKEDPRLAEALRAAEEARRELAELKNQRRIEGLTIPDTLGIAPEDVRELMQKVVLPQLDSVRTHADERAAELQKQLAESRDAHAKLLQQIHQSQVEAARNAQYREVKRRFPEYDDIIKQPRFKAYLGARTRMGRTLGEEAQAGIERGDLTPLFSILETYTAARGAETTANAAALANMVEAPAAGTASAPVVATAAGANQEAEKPWTQARYAAVRKERKAGRITREEFDRLMDSYYRAVAAGKVDAV